MRNAIDLIQKDILQAFSIEEDESLRNEPKIIDMISFLYEISQSESAGFTKTKRELLGKIYKRKKDAIVAYAREKAMDDKKVGVFLKRMHL